jgi:hypothetical protein
MSGPSERTVPGTDADEQAATAERAGGSGPAGTAGRAGDAPQAGSPGLVSGGEIAQTALAAEPGFLERGRMRRRARYLRQLREVQLRDIGGFMLELKRFGREQPDLVQAKLAGAASTDSELRALERALGDEQPLRELREAGIGGACPHCRAVYGSSDRYCASCGEPVPQRGRPAAQPPERGRPTARPPERGDAPR